MRKHENIYLITTFNNETFEIIAPNINTAKDIAVRCGKVIKNCQREFKNGRISKGYRECDLAILSLVCGADF